MTVTLCSARTQRPATKPVRPERAPFDNARKPSGAFTACEVMLTMRPNGGSYNTSNNTWTFSGTIPQQYDKFTNWAYFPQIAVAPRVGMSSNQVEYTVALGQSLSCSMGVSPATFTGTATPVVNWSSSDATGCTASGGGTTNWAGSKSTGGTWTSNSTINQTTNFSLTCTNKNTNQNVTCSGSPATSNYSSVTSVTVSPSSASVQVGKSQFFSVLVSGSGSPSQAVVWSVDGVNGGNSTVGAISGNSYTAPATVPSPATVTVKATSVQDSTKSGMATVTITPTSGGGGGGQQQAASCISISAPGTVTQGQHFAATVVMKNIGTATWQSVQVNSTHPYRLGAQDPQDNTLWGLGRVDLPQSTVVPNAQVTFAINGVAPATAGTYSFDWEMVQDGVTWFGSKCTSNVVVSGQQSPGNTVSLSANPNPAGAGSPVTLTATAGGNAAGTINYTFWWNCPAYSLASNPTVAGATAACGDPTNATIGEKFSGVSQLSEQAVNTYGAQGTYQPIVIMERGSSPAALGTVVLGVSGLSGPDFSLSASPSTLSIGQGGSGQVNVTASPSNGPLSLSLRSLVAALLPIFASNSPTQRRSCFR